MTRARTATRLLALTAGAAATLVATQVVAAAPAQADPAGDAFVNALGNAGVPVANPADAVALGQSVCPMLAEPGQNAANAAAQVADAAGMPLGPATMFTGMAITMFCPSVMASVGNGQNPLAGLPTGLLGF